MDSKTVRETIESNNIDVHESIRKCITKHGKEIRENQVEAIYDIIYAFIFEEYENVVLNASTGIGKSIIGIVVYEVLEALFKLARIVEPDSSYIAVQNNNLVDQYDNDYSHSIKSFLVVKGASNYPCLIHKDNNASECMFHKFKQKGDKIKMKICERCEYLINRARIDISKTVVTNYQYLVTKSLYAGGMDKRLISIYDESHLFSDSFVDFVSFEYTIELINGIITNVQKFNMESEFRMELDDLIKNISKISVKNYEKHLDKFKDLVKRIVKQFNAEISDLEAQNRDEEAMKYVKVAVKLSRYLSNLSLYDDIEFEFVTSEVWSTDPNKKQKIGISLRPIFIKGLYKNLEASDYKLFMSGTNDDVSFDIEVGLENYKYINLTPVFPKSSKFIHFMNYGNLNATAMNDPQTIPEMGDMLEGIILNEEGKKGVIHSNSFDLSRKIFAELNKKNLDIKIFCQEQGEKVSDYVASFKAYKKPAILISPSCVEGVDFPYEQCEFMVILRMPFGFYGDARQKYIANNYRSLYNIKALKSIIQMIGRGTRAIDDKCTTYIFDSRVWNSFNSNLNKWKAEFEYEVH